MSESVRENMGIDKEINIDWSKFKSGANGKMLEKAKESYIEFCQMIDEVDFELISDYVNNRERVELAYKFGGSFIINTATSDFKRTYKRIINFKNNLIKNGDEFVKFVGLTDRSNLMAKIRTFDGGIINVDIGAYKEWNSARQDFYKKLKEVNGFTTDCYISATKKIKLCIDNVKLKPLTIHNFKKQTYKTIINLKKRTRREW